MYRLHCFSQSGNSFKVAMLLNALGVPWEPVFVDFFKGEARDPNWRGQVNAMGEAPVLEDGELLLTQSGVILTHLAEKHGRYGGETAEERREILRWILFDNHKFTSYFASYRFMKAFMRTEPDPAVMAWLKGRIDQTFAVVESHLATRRYVVADKPTIADISMAGYMFYPPDESGYRFGDSHPNIAAWAKRIKELPGWREPYEAMPGERFGPFR